MTAGRLLADIRPLRESPAFRRLWAGSTLSAVGGALTMFAVPLQVYDITRSPLAVGAIGVAQVVPTVAIGLLGGAIADAVDRRTLVLVATSGSAAVSAALAAQAFAGLQLGLAAVRPGRRVVLDQRDQRAGPADLHPEPAAGRPADGRPRARPAEFPAHADRRAGPGRADHRGAGPRPARRATSSTRSASPARCTASPGCRRCRDCGARAAAGSPLGRRGSQVHRAQPGAQGRIPGRPERHHLRPAGRAVPGHQRRALRRRPAHAGPVHHRDRNRRPDQRGAIRAGRADHPAGPGHARRGRRLGCRVRGLRDRGHPVADPRSCWP